MSTDDIFSIKGKKTLITGGTAGIGLGVAKHFVNAGAEVVITGRRESGEKTAEDIGAKFVRMDVSDPESAFSALLLGAMTASTRPISKVFCETSLGVSRSEWLRNFRNCAHTPEHFRFFLLRCRPGCPASNPHLWRKSA